MTMMRRNNLLTAFLLFLTVTLVQVSLVNSLDSRENQSMDYSGNYEMRSASKDGVVQDIIPARRVITMKMEQQAEDPAVYRLSIKVANILMSSLKIIQSEGGVETIQVGAVASTRMMPPPDLEPLEFFVSDYFPQFDKMEMTNDIIVMQGGGAEIKWQQANDEEDAE